MNILQYCPTLNVTCKALTNQGIYPQLVYSQGCALAEPGGPWRLTFALGRLQHSLAFKYFPMETLREKWGDGSKGALLKLQAHNTATGQCLC